MHNHIKVYRISKTRLKYILATLMLDSMFIAIFRQVKTKEIKEKLIPKM